MDAGADIRDQQEFADTHPFVLERDHIARQPHATSFERVDYRRRPCLVGHQSLYNLQNGRDPRVVRPAAVFRDKLIPGKVIGFCAAKTALATIKPASAATVTLPKSK